MKMKTCTRCKTEKPLDDFGLNFHSPDYHLGLCKDCTRETNMARYAKRKAEYYALQDAKKKA